MHGPPPTLIDIEARVLGVLIEKALTTPDQYPLSLNATTNGCNQKSNRDPVVEYSEAEVMLALHGLTPKGLGGRVLVAGSRVERFRHTANEKLGLRDDCLAVLAELLMRGPQAPGELRARVNRMAPTPSLDELRERLDLLVERRIVARCAPAAGSRTERYVQLLCPGLHGDVERVPAHSSAVPSATPREVREPAAPAVHSAPATPGVEARLDRLEARVEELSKVLARLTDALGG